jgi:hypothetical protein
MIPRGEGRNDVFSTVYTHFPIAPDVILYDFSCQAATYCMTREPDFFKRTRFLIDCFHEDGHSSCSPATRMSVAREHNQVLKKVNTSIAESGNAKLKRIKLSTSYMGQARAILYVKTFLSIINREKLLQMMSQGSEKRA